MVVLAALAEVLPKADGQAAAALGRAADWLDTHPPALAKLTPDLRTAAGDKAPASIFPRPGPGCQ